MTRSHRSRDRTHSPAPRLEPRKRMQRRARHLAMHAEAMCSLFTVLVVVCSPAAA